MPNTLIHYEGTTLRGAVVERVQILDRKRRKSANELGGLFKVLINDKHVLTAYGYEIKVSCA